MSVLSEESDVRVIPGIEVWLGMNLWGEKNRAPHVTLPLSDGRKLHIGIRWAKLTGGDDGQE